METTWSWSVTAARARPPEFPAAMGDRLGAFLVDDPAALARGALAGGPEAEDVGA